MISISEQKHRDFAFLVVLLESESIETVRQETDLQVFLVLNVHHLALSQLVQHTLRMYLLFS